MLRDEFKMVNRSKNKVVTWVKKEGGPKYEKSVWYHLWMNPFTKAYYTVREGLFKSYMKEGVLLLFQKTHFYLNTTGESWINKSLN